MSGTRRTDATPLKKDEGGFILILALVTMLAMTIIGLSMIMNMSTDVQLSRNERDAKTSFQLAEAGVNEAMARIKLPSGNARYIGEIVGDAGGPPNRNNTWNSDDSKNFGFGQGGVKESADGLNYTVTIRYLDETNPEGFCDSNNNTFPNNDGNADTFGDPAWPCVAGDQEVVMFGRDFKLSDTFTYTSFGRHPVYEVTSIGTSNGTTRTVVAYVGATSLNTDTEAGINTNSTITWNGGGCDVSVTPAGSCMQAQTNDYNTHLGETVNSIKEMANEKHQCSTNTCNGAGDDIPSNGGLEGVVMDWGDFAGDGWSTMIYIDNASPGRAVSMNGLVGRGILVVEGDLELAGNVDYEGLIYVLGTLTISGGGASTKNITGGIMAQDVVTLNGNNLSVQYDQATLEEVAKQNSKPALVLWKRL
ncbi:MAG TPA: PilX N-terminal domain-containing pilus assembly protein [Thermodesulfobacteriota bacterium]